jgi:hypothetical protein
MVPADDWVVGEKGYTLDFDSGSSQHVLFSDIWAWHSLSLPISMSAWVNVGSLASQRGVFASDDFAFNSGKYYGCQLSITTSGYLTMVYGDGDSPSSSARRSFTQNAGTSVGVGAWYHVAGVITGETTGSLWVNGQSQPFATSGTGSVMKHSAWPGGLGRQTATSHFDGLMGPVSFYDRELTIAEVQQLYEDPLAPLAQRQTIFQATAVEPLPAPTPTPLIISHHSAPSYDSGFAQSIGESRNPHLWDGLVGLWVPSLGPTGDTLYDVSGFENHGSLTNMDPAWLNGQDKLGLCHVGFDGMRQIVLAQLF